VPGNNWEVGKEIVVKGEMMRVRGKEDKRK
jgi:hypothetical protein